MLRNARKPRFHRHFCVLRKHSQKFSERENACTPRRASIRRHRSILLRAAALTHKIKRSHCYFSPAVVIRLQCGSIRDCTAPRSPSTLRLGGQQWRRREKRRKRQRRPRSVGRRSSQCRNRSSASHVSKIASHGPASVEADHHLPRRAGSGGQRGAPAGCGCELRNSGSLSAKAKRGETGYLKSAGLRASGSPPQPSRRSPRCVGSILPKLYRRCGSRRRFFVGGMLCLGALRLGAL